MLGHETVTAGIAGPEIADHVVVKVGGSFRCHHGIGTHRACRQIRSTRIRPKRYSRPDFSKCCHRDLLRDLNLKAQLTTKVYTELFDDVATQMRSWTKFLRSDFALQRIIFGTTVSGLRIDAGTS